MTPEEQRAVSMALLGSWPGTITRWGREAFAAYICELDARNLSAEAVLGAIRTWPAGSDFPPSVPNLAAAARQDASEPSAAEAIQLIYGKGGVLRARAKNRNQLFSREKLKLADEEAQWQRATTMHPLIAAFVHSQGVGWLEKCDPFDDEFGGANRRKFEIAWNEFVGRQDTRELAGRLRRGEIRHLDPLEALRRDLAELPELEPGE